MEKLSVILETDRYKYVVRCFAKVANGKVKGMVLSVFTIIKKNQLPLVGGGTQLHQEHFELDETIARVGSINCEMNDPIVKGIRTYQLNEL